MTDANELIAQSKSICEAATPGPWSVDDTSDDDEGWIEIEGVWACGPSTPAGMSKADAIFIATARTLVPELAAALEELTERHRMTVETKLFSRRKLESDVVTLARERDEARRKVLDLKSQRTLFQNEEIESLHLKVSSLERDAVHHRREHQLVTEEYGKLKRERDEARAELERLKHPGSGIGAFGELKAGWARIRNKS